jgi:hypothetical protein
MLIAVTAAAVLLMPTVALEEGQEGCNKVLHMVVDSGS